MNATWALENRSVAIRVKGLAGAGLHTENRVPCRASNPYLVGAPAIAAGLDGLRNRIEPPPATEGLAYGLDGPTPIPTRLEAALDALRFFITGPRGQAQAGHRSGAGGPRAGHRGSGRSQHAVPGPAAGPTGQCRAPAGR